MYSIALKTILNEIRNVCPDIKNSFIFREDGEIIAGDNNTPEKTIVQTINSFEGIFEKADALGGIDNITVESSKGRITVSPVKDLYLLSVTSEDADQKHVDTVTGVLIPTFLKLLGQITQTPTRDNSPKRETETLPTKDVEETTEDIADKLLPEETEKMEEPEPYDEPLFPEPPVNQCIVEPSKHKRRFPGLPLSVNTVHLDNRILSQWQELYKNKPIEQVEIETFNGKTIQCKVKPAKDPEREGKGIIQIPEKIQNTLDIKKGELVKVKPIINNGDTDYG